MPGTLTYREILEHAERLEDVLVSYRRRVRTTASDRVRGRLNEECAALQSRIDEIRLRCEGHDQVELYAADV